METAIKNYTFYYLSRILGNTKTYVFWNMVPSFETRIWPNEIVSSVLFSSDFG